ncbi:MULTISPECIES: hypothetical protein [Kitasatospora]|uniref:Uncharacterized protein n=1 Tax=Kitasatospora cystarginea TaxID=58350 RepID=A0ABN3DV81_9ACTN
MGEDASVAVGRVEVELVEGTSGMCSGSTSTTNEAWYRPAGSSTIVTDDGSAGRERDHFTRTSPIFAKFSFPFERIRNPLREKRSDCRLVG